MEIPWFRLPSSRPFGHRLRRNISFMALKLLGWVTMRFHPNSGNPTPFVASPLRAGTSAIAEFQAKAVPLQLWMIWTFEHCRSALLATAQQSQARECPRDARHAAIFAEDGQALEQTEADRLTAHGHAQRMNNLADLYTLRLNKVMRSFFQCLRSERLGR